MSKKKKKQQNKSNKPSKIIVWIIGIVAIVIAVIIFLSNANTSSNTNSANEIDYDGQPFLGEESAPVKIVEFGDYKCIHCKNFNDTLFPQIKKDLVDTGKASFYFINYSFINTDSIRSAKFAETVYKELGNEKFWEFHELLFENHPGNMESEKKDVLTQSFLEEALSKIATDEETKKVMDSFEKDSADAAWKTDMDMVKELNVQSTPTLFINGKKFEGSSYDDLKKAVEEAANKE
nr:thioredoxin domain-containing protein [Aquibacillus kalidii]